MHPQSGVECLHGCVFFQLSKAGDGILADPTGHDARKMGQIGSDVDGKAVQRHPSAYAYANGADFGLTSIWSIRSEEHTSELQSLMRLSYAVFCLQKKNYKKINSATDSYQKHN